MTSAHITHQVVDVDRARLHADSRPRHCSGDRGDQWSGGVSVAWSGSVAAGSVGASSWQDSGGSGFGTPPLSRGGALIARHPPSVEP